MKLSATRLKTLFTCPRQFKYAYVEEIPAVPTGPLVFGQVIHQTLYQLHTRSRQEKIPLSIELALSEFDWLWRAALEEQKPLFKDGPEEVQRYWDLADDMLRGYVQSQQGQPPPLVLELPFELPLRLSGAGGKVSDDHRLTGIIDRIEEGANGLIIVDYKTGKRKPPARELEDDLQLTIYAFAVERLLQQPVERIVYHRLRYGQSLVTTRNESDFRRLCDEVLPHAVAAIESGRFAPHYGFWCRFCDFRELCQAEGPNGYGSSLQAQSKRKARQTVPVPMTAARKEPASVK